MSTDHHDQTEPGEDGPEVPRKPSGERDWDAWAAKLPEDAYPGPTGPGDAETGPGVPVDSVEAQTGTPTGTGEARPVLPEWAKSRTGLTGEAKRAARLALHRLAYHAVRGPLYAARVALYAPRGAFRLAAMWGRWCFDEEGRPLRSATAARDDYEAYRKLVLVRDRHVRWRGLVSAVVGGAGAVGVLAALGAGGLWSWGLGVVTVAACGLVGRPADRPLLDTAVVKTSLAPLTSEVVYRSLTSLGIGGITTAIGKNPKAIAFVAPIVRDGEGWRAEVDLPFGVTAAEVMERRDKLASGLARPVGCVWPEGRGEIHPGRLVVWVGDQDMASACQPAWPHAKGKAVNLFEPVQVGTDPRGRAVKTTLMYASGVIGAIPRMGKTFAARLLMLAAALDVRSEIHAFDLKGTGDFKPVAPVAHAYRAGDEDEDLAYVMADLRRVHSDMQRRTRVIRDLPSDVCPENKVTDALASKKSLGLHPVFISIDECQRLFEHPEFGDEAEALAEDLVRRGPATGIMLWLATQRPDSKSIPKGIADNAVLRLCLKVNGQVANDMVLGTSMYKQGVRASAFSFNDKGIAYLVGEGEAATVVKNHFVDGPAAEKIAGHARAAREAAGRLTGYAAGEATEADTQPAYDLAADLLAAWPSGVKSAWNAELVDRLAELRPEAYGLWAGLDEEHKTAQLTRSLRLCGAHELVKQVGRRDGSGKTINRRGIGHDDIRNFVTERDRKKGA
ncbi:FtsK/SpoIIIE domain-containing protein [Glycomyces tarimensis]